MYLEQLVCPLEILDTSNDNPYQFHCTKCPKSFADNKSIALHFKQEHNEKSSRTFECEKCGKVYPRSFLLMTHIKSAHDKIRDHICSVCHKGFAKRSVLNRHLKCVHSGEKNYICEICGKAFVAKKNLEFHIDGLHRQLKPHQCMFCNKSFARRCDLVRHNQCMHTEKKNYNCSFCTKGFPQKWHLDRHINAVHLKNKAKYVKPKTEEKIILPNNNTNGHPHQASNNTNPTQIQTSHNPESALVNFQSNQLSQDPVQFIDSTTGLPISSILNNNTAQFSLPSTQMISHNTQQPQQFQQIITNNGTFLLPLNTPPSLDLAHGQAQLQQSQNNQTLCLIAGNDGNLFTVNLNPDAIGGQLATPPQQFYQTNPSNLMLNQFLASNSSTADVEHIQLQTDGNLHFIPPEDPSSNSIETKLFSSDLTNLEDLISLNLFQNPIADPLPTQHQQQQLSQLQTHTHHQQMGNQLEALKPLESNSKVFLCDYCDKYYTRKQSLSAHVLQKHSNKQPFKCLLCEKGFVRRWEFYRHVSTNHHGFFRQAVGEDRAEDFNSWLLKNKPNKN